MAHRPNALPPEFVERVVNLVRAGGTVATIAALVPPRQCRACGAVTPKASQAYCSTACRPVSVARKAERKRGKASYTRPDKPAVLEALIKAQCGRCASCAGDGGKRGLVLDHDHETGDARAALCFDCNSAFGLLGESVERLEGLLAFARSVQRKAVA